MYLIVLFCLVLCAGGGCAADLETFLFESLRDRAVPKMDNTDEFMLSGSSPTLAGCLYRPVAVVDDLRQLASCKTLAWLAVST